MCNLYNLYGKEDTTASVLYLFMLLPTVWHSCLLFPWFLVLLHTQDTCCIFFFSFSEHLLPFVIDFTFPKEAATDKKKIL